MAETARGVTYTSTEPLGHRDVTTTHTHVLNRGPAGVLSRAERIVG